MRQKRRIIEGRHHKFHMKSMNSFRIRIHECFDQDFPALYPQNCYVNPRAKQILTDFENIEKTI